MRVWRPLRGLGGLRSTAFRPRSTRAAGQAVPVLTQVLDYADLVDGCETFLLAYELVNDHVASEARREVPSSSPREEDRQTAESQSREMIAQGAAQSRAEC